MWTKLDDGFHDDPKIAGLSDAAFRLFVCALTWSGRHLQDGAIPTGVVRLLGDPDAASELLQAGLWLEGDDGWQIGKYLEFQPSAAKVKADRQAARERQQKRRSPDVTDVSRRSSRERGRESHDPDPTRPDPSKSPPTPPVDNSVDEALKVFAGAQNLKPSKRWVARNRKPMLEAAELVGVDYLLEFVEWAVDAGCRLPTGLSLFAGDFMHQRRPDLPICTTLVGCGGRTWIDGPDGEQVKCPDCRETWP